VLKISDELCSVGKMTYCGCGTTGAKIRWAVVALMLVLGVALIVAGSVNQSQCKLCTPDGKCDDRGGTYHNVNGNEYYTNVDGEIVDGASELSTT
jgi:hypothetical protein